MKTCFLATGYFFIGFLSFHFIGPVVKNGVFDKVVLLILCSLALNWFYFIESVWKETKK